jgi:transcriptional repressor OPI1
MPSSSLAKPHTPQPEPLLSLLTTSHPLLATTIEGATSAYNNSKNFSPRFKSSAEYVEGYVTPIANTIGSVGRVTGVEGGVRWFLGGSRRHRHSVSDLEAGQGGSNKRRKMDTTADSRSHESDLALLPARETDQSRDPYVFKHDRRLSMASTVDTLPAYDENTSPAYTETLDGQQPERPSSSSAAWQSRLIMSTSGLSIAMSEESLRSLKYCLKWLRWANDHIGKIIGTLSTTIDQYDRVEQPAQGEAAGAAASEDHSMAGLQGPVVYAQDRSEIAAKIASLKGDVLKTLQAVIETVSKYAGGALPENARVLVRRHLTSLPQRFRVASMMDDQAAQQPGEPSEHDEEAQRKAMREGANRVLVLAKEGLDMVAQVSGVLDGTIVSAEEWCDRLGKKKREDREAMLPGSEPTFNEKVGEKAG